jgi:AcrR family transcriptional regulator
MAAGARSRSKRPDRRTKAARAEGTDGREQLLEAAAWVFAERGFRAASVEEIAERAGFSKGAVYWHFEGKEDLLFALLEERVDAPMREIIALLESGPPEKEAAPEASRLFVEQLERQRDLVLLEHEYRALAARDGRARKRYARRQQQLREALAAGLEARMRTLGGPPVGGSAVGVATAFMSLAQGLSLERLIDEDAVPDELLGEILNLVYAGLVAKGA